MFEVKWHKDLVRVMSNPKNVELANKFGFDFSDLSNEDNVNIHTWGNLLQKLKENGIKGWF